MSYTEQIVTFACQGEQLLGIVSLPSVAEAAGKHVQTPGVVIIVGGPQYRAGSHRQFVLLARALASTGTPVLRFDYRGMGDSTGSLHTFENVNEDIAAGIDALQMAAPNVQNVALWGLCDGASAALLYCHATQDKRVKGLCLLNPWVRSAASLAKTQVKHYYTQRLRQKEFWVKLLSGKVATSAATSLLQNIRKTFFTRSTVSESHAVQVFQDRMGAGWKLFTHPIFLCLSGDDYTAKEFLEYAKSHVTWSGALAQERLTQMHLPNADHTFSHLIERESVEKKTAEWLQQSIGTQNVN